MQADKSEQQQLRKHIDGVFVRDNNMKQFAIENGFCFLPFFCGFSSPSTRRVNQVAGLPRLLHNPGAGE